MAETPGGLSRFWSVELPARLDRLAPTLADRVADGAWTAAWPGVAGVAPLVALVVGLLAPRSWPGLDHVYSESLSFMLVVIAGAIFSGPVGVMLFLGFVVGDFFGGGAAASIYRGGLLIFFRQRGSQLIGYLLLAIPALVVPPLARRMARQVLLPLRPEALIWERAALYATGCGVLIYLWAQGMIVLIRPVFTWLNAPPTVPAIYQVQHRWSWLVGVAVLAAMARVVLEQAVSARLPRISVVMELHRQRWAVGHRGTIWQGLPTPLRIGMETGIIMLLLSGTYEGWLDALIVMVVGALLSAWRAGLTGWLPATWGEGMRKVPAMLRLAAAPFLGYQLATLVFARVWKGNSFKPVLFGALLTLVVFHVLFPYRPEAAQAVDVPKAEGGNAG